MKILFITPSPPNDLNRIRSKNILIALSKLGHEVTLVSLYKNKKEFGWLKETEKYVSNFYGVHHPVFLSLFFCLFGLFSKLPLRVAFCFSPKLKKVLRDISKNNYDVIYIKRLRMSYCASLFEKEKIFVDITDSMTKYYDRLKDVSKGIQKLLAYEEYFKHRIYESNVCKKLKNIVVCSEEDKKYIVNELKCSPENIKILENGLDTEKWKIVSDKSEIDINKLVFLGVMNVDTNKLSVEFFIDKIFTKLDDRYTFTVIGPKPEETASKYRNKRVSFLGYVDDVQSAISKFDIFVCPIIAGAGVKNKILQSAISGLLIVATELGVEGIDNELKKLLIVAKNPEDFVGKIYSIKNLSREDISNRLKLQAEFTQKRYDIVRLVKKFADQNFY